MVLVPLAVPVIEAQGESGMIEAFQFRSNLRPCQNLDSVERSEGTWLRPGRRLES